jgi:hypothetical protein
MITRNEMDTAGVLVSEYEFSLRAARLAVRRARVIGTATLSCGGDRMVTVISRERPHGVVTFGIKET